MSVPAIRGTDIQASTNSTYTVPWPTGTVVGDLAIILTGHAYNANNPTGWTVNDNQSGSNFNGAVFSRILNSADITAGSMTLTFGGSFNGVIAIISLIGAYVINQTVATRNGGGSSTITLTSTLATATSLLVYFGSNRGASTNTVSRGTLQRQVNDGSNASGCLYTEGGSGNTSPVFNYSSPGAGNYQAIVVVDNPPVITAPTLTSPVSFLTSGHQTVKPPSSGGGAAGGGPVGYTFS